MEVTCPFFGQTARKVKVLDVHPVLSWVVTADESGLICIWDYAARKVVHAFSPQTIEAEREQQDMQAEAFPADGKHSSSHSSGRRSRTRSSRRSTVATSKGGGPGHAGGKVHAVRFYDASVLKWCTSSRGHRSPGTWVIVVFADRLLLIDYTTRGWFEVPSAAMLSSGLTQHGGHGHGLDRPPKELRCAEPVSGSVVAVGGSDGVVRLVDVFRGQLCNALRGGHGSKEAVVRLLSVPPANRSIFGEWDAPLTGGDADHTDVRELQTLGLISVGERDVALWRADPTAEGGAALVGKIAGGVRLVRAAGQEKEKGDSHTVVPDCVSYDTAAQVGLGLST